MPDKTYAKVVLNGTTYVDLTSDTVDPSTLLAGYTAHDRSGALITGSFDTSIFVLKAGDTMTGPLILSGAPTENLHAATKKYVDDAAANYVTLTTDQNITGTKTFVGQKKILFKQSSTSDKLGFTLYKSDSTEQGYLEYNPSNKVDNAPLFTLGNYATTTSGICQVGFRRYSGVSGANGAYNLLTPLIADAKTPFSLNTTYTNFYLPLGFTVDSANTLKTAKSGVVDFSPFFTIAKEKVKQTSTISSSDTELRVLLSYQGTNSDEVAQVKKCNYFTFDTMHSILTIFRRGSADTTVKAGLILGNNVAGGTYGNSYGDIVMYGQGTYYYNITGNNTSEALTENRTLTLPNKSGTLAVTDDLDSYVLKTGDSLSGALSFYDGNTLKSKISNTELQINGHDLLRMTPHFAQMFATQVLANKNLNTNEFLKVGQYYCNSGATVATLSNCPATAAFTMTVEAPIQTEYDDESLTTGSYRLRTIKTYTGEVFIQYVTRSNGGSYYYYSWQPYIIGYTAGNLQVNTSGASLDEAYCKQYGKTVNVRAWITGLSTSTQTHTNVITVQLVDKPTTAVRFVFTCWLGNGIAAYAGYGVMDTSGRITLVKAVANSDKASFEFTYNV